MHLPALEVFTRIAKITFRNNTILPITVGGKSIEKSADLMKCCVALNCHLHYPHSLKDSFALSLCTTVGMNWNESCTEATATGVKY